MTGISNHAESRQAAMSARLSPNTSSIDSEEDSGGQERLARYRLLSDFLNAR